MTQFVYCSCRHTGLKHEVACCIFGCFELHYCAGTKSWNIALQYKPNPSVMKLQAMTASRTTIWTRRPRQPTSPGPHTLALKWQRCTHPNLALYLTLSSFYPKIYLLLQKKTPKNNNWQLLWHVIELFLKQNFIFSHCPFLWLKHPPPSCIHKTSTDFRHFHSNHDKMLELEKLVVSMCDILSFIYIH